MPQGAGALLPASATSGVDAAVPVDPDPDPDPDPVPGFATQPPPTEPDPLVGASLPELLASFVPLELPELPKPNWADTLPETLPLPEALPLPDPLEPTEPTDPAEAPQPPQPPQLCPWPVPKHRALTVPPAAAPPAPEGVIGPPQAWLTLAAACADADTWAPVVAMTCDAAARHALALESPASDPSSAGVDDGRVAATSLRMVACPWRSARMFARCAATAA